MSLYLKILLVVVILCIISLSILFIKKDCQDGTYSSSGKGSFAYPCSKCPVNLVSNSDKTKCIGCPLGKGLNEEGTKCIDCDKGMYNNTDDGYCKKCPAGFYQDETGKSDCKQNKELGMYSYEGWPGVMPCEKGTYGTVDRWTLSAICEPCPAGTYNDVEGTKSIRDCKICAAGTFANVPGSETCEPCPGGTWGTITEATSQKNGCSHECPEGTYSETKGSTIDTCVPCADGTFSGKGAYKCRTCRTGQQLKNGECTECPPGTYSDSSTDTCISCPAGTYRDTPGGKSINDCTECPAGSYNDELGMVNPQCKKCISMYNDTTGNTDCKLCHPGEIANDTSTGCTECPAGTYQTFNEQNQMICAECGPGTFWPGVAAISCISCPGTVIFHDVSKKPVRCELPRNIPCDSDNPCISSNMTCTDGFCTPIIFDCTQHIDCAGGYCRDGKCVMGGNCTSDDQCNTGKNISCKTKKNQRCRGEMVNCACSNKDEKVCWGGLCEDGSVPDTNMASTDYLNPKYFPNMI